MAKVTFDYSIAKQFFSNEELRYMKTTAEAAKQVLLEKTGAGNDFLGWIDLPVDYDKEEFERILAAAKKILNFCAIVFITLYRKKYVKPLRFIMLVIILAVLT